MPDPQPLDTTRPRATSHPELSTGPGRILVATYAVFAVAATGRSLVQLGADAGRAPLAYSLSLLAAVLYLVATTCLLLGTERARRVALVAVAVEAAGVLVVGTLSYVATDLFPDRTVWSHFGQGYGFLPLVLPALGLWWLLVSGGRVRTRDGLGDPSLNGPNQ